MRFDLYLESGPQHRKTWVYAPGLAGCSSVAPTTAEALEVAALAVRERIDFLRRHGGDVTSMEPFELVVAEHVIERQFLGFGQQFFDADLAPLATDEASRLLLWADWSREELVAAARAQPLPRGERPPTGGRSTIEILSHVAGAEWSYVSAALGTLPGQSAAMRDIEAAGDEPWAALAAEREAVAARLGNLTPDDLGRVVEREGRPRWTARRMFRRLLEHEWEHVRELRARA
jgi:hypothetical protein